MADGDVVMVHAAVRSVGPIVGGVTVLVQSILDAVGHAGTLVAYVDWENDFDALEPGTVLDDDIPAFGKRIARASREYGILPEVMRTWPGAVRNDNPDAGVAAIGARADWLCERHAYSCGYGEDSPYAKLVAVGAKVLMLGAPLDTMTLLHHAEHVASIAGKRVRHYRRKILVDGAPTWIEVEEFESSEPVLDGMPDDHFSQIARAAIAAGVARYGRIGCADSYVFPARDLQRTAVRWLEEWRPEASSDARNRQSRNVHAEDREP